MDISRENEYLLYLAVQSVRGGRVMTLPEGQDYASLFSRAGQAGVFRAVAGGIAPQLLPDEARKTLDGIAARELRKQHDAAAILAALENEGVDCLPLDGFAFGALYTGEAKREIKDFNILIREQQAEKADRLLTKRGLELFREGEGVGCYRGRNAPNIFLHTQSGAYGGRFPLWEWARPLDGVRCAYTLSPEQRLVCALARAEDARRSDRCAVKPLLDAFVLCNAYDGAWNEDYIRALAETYGLAAVLRDTEKLYGCYFAQKHRDGYYFKALDSFFAPGRKSLPPAAAGPLRRARRKRAKTAAIYVSAAAVVVATVVICSMLLPGKAPAPPSDAVSGTESGDATIRLADGVYTGETSDGLPHGEGAIEYDSGDGYEGSFVAGRREGYGVYTFANGDRYEGSFAADEINGEGSFYFADGDIITGEFENGLPNGACVCTYADGKVYAGTMKDGLYDGYGTATYPNGDRYEGSFAAGQRNGEGTYTYAGGAVYTGAWKDGAMEGEGVFTSEAGTYTGSFKAGMFDGYGVYVFANGDRYEGDFVAGKRQSDEATLTYSGGGSYTGAFENDLFHGAGTLTFANGDVVKGNFVNGLLEGEADFYLNEKDIWQKLRYENGKIVEYLDD